MKIDRIEVVVDVLGAGERLKIGREVERVREGKVGNKAEGEGEYKRKGRHVANGISLGSLIFQVPPQQNPRLQNCHKKRLELRSMI